MLILAAITASFVGVRRRLRRPVLLGAILGLLASVFTWVLAQTLLQSLSRYGEKLEAVVGLIAIGGAAADHQLVLPPRLLERVDRALPPPAAQADGEGAGRLLVGAGARAGRARAHERLPRGLRDRAVPAVARAQRRRDGGDRGRRPRPRAHARRGGADLRAAAQAALQEDADRHRRAARGRAGGHGRPDRAHDAGHRLAADHAAGLGDPLLARALAGRLPERRDARRPGRARSCS